MNEMNRLNQKKIRLENDVARNKSASNTLVTYKIVTNYGWSDSKETVKIYIDLEPGEVIPESEVTLDFPDKRSFVVIFGTKKFTLTKLQADLDPTKSRFTVTSKRLTLHLKKALPKDWSSLKDVTNSMKKTTDEDKEEFGDGGGDPQDGLMKLMKKMYDEGDDEMKRTIAKTWYESQNKKSSGLSDFP